MQTITEFEPAPNDPNNRLEEIDKSYDSVPQIPYQPQFRLNESLYFCLPSFPAEQFIVCICYTCICLYMFCISATLHEILLTVILKKVQFTM